MNTFLTIAGSDPSGGAGIQADIKTASALNIYAMSVITALTVQNTLGVTDVFPAPNVYEQGTAVFDDIFPDSVKIGMCVNSSIIRTIEKLLSLYKPDNVVLDPILISSSGKELLPHSAVDDMKKLLFTKVDIITPNVPEAEYITDTKICNETDCIKAAKQLYEQYGCSVLLKGGHLNGCDIFYDGNVHQFGHKLVDNPNTHGTGCTLSSAVACMLAKGENQLTACENAVKYVVSAIESGLALGKGTGPLNHLFDINR